MSKVSHEQRKTPDRGQLLAADPALSVWVSANAGSGKTTVLTSRVVRLLLSGADPARILCVTFTKAAAANMQNRIFEALGKWVALENADLSNAITEMTGERPREGDLKKARRLFAQAVETPGGLKIQTIHGFCERILHLFPFEAAVPAQFKVLDDVEQSAITESVINATLQEALAYPDSLPGRALSTVTVSNSEDSFREALRVFMNHRKDREPPTLEIKYAQSKVRALLNIKAGETTESVDREIVSQGLYDGNWREIADWLKSSGKARDGKMADALQNAAGNQGEQKAAIYIQAFLSKELKPLSDNGYFISSDLRKSNTLFTQTMLDERERVFNLMQHRLNIATAERTEAICLLADSILAKYRAEKRRLGRLDFPDLIGKVVKLLTADTARWVLYKLDQGLDHVLVDEAQDTSPEQWKIVKAIADDFFDGESARSEQLQRTIFAVGDEKQSIFGFQGAKPDEFDAARRHFKGQIDTHNRDAPRPHGFESVPLQTSYRTVDDVLKAVDQVFSIEAHYEGIDSNNQPTIHESNRKHEPGLVELWPTIAGEKVETPNAADPVDSVPVDAPARLLARRIAKRIAFWSQTKARFENDGELITPGDILVLVRSRGPIFEGVIKALKDQNVPVAGADRMKLKEQIAVLDLLALGRFCLLPDDDLTLATLLKSPFFGLDDTDLITLASERGPISLWQSLLTMAGAEPRYRAIALELKDLIAQAKQMTPHAFYMHCLSVNGGRRKLVARIGLEAEEAITVFLSQLRQWQASNPPSLLGFIEAMAASETDVKRDMEEAHGRVRVMTVHASKGLEARIVFLADLFHKPGGKNSPRLIELMPGDLDSAIWSPSKDGDSEKITEAKLPVDADTLAESRRLLYVALTRAKDRLYLAGAHGVQKSKQQTWHSIIEAALVGHENLKDVPDETGEGRVSQWTTVPRRSVPAAKDNPVVEAKKLPDWLFQSKPNDLPRPPPLRPSRLVDAAEPTPLRDAVTARAQARLRGDLIHHLLQHLPAVCADRRPVVAQSLGAAKFPSLDQAVAQAAIASTITLISDSRFAALFAGEARAEVDIAGRITLKGQSIEVAGRIDRLAITEAEIILMDYKTGQPPRDPSEIPLTHLSQLAVYELLLRDLYPERTITTAIIWTALPEVVIIPPEQLRFALQSIKAA